MHYGGLASPRLDSNAPSLSSQMAVATAAGSVIFVSLGRQVERRGRTALTARPRLPANANWDRRSRAHQLIAQVRSRGVLPSNNRKWASTRTIVFSQNEILSLSD